MEIQKEINNQSSIEATQDLEKEPKNTQKKSNVYCWIILTVVLIILVSFAFLNFNGTFQGKRFTFQKFLTLTSEPTTTPVVVPTLAIDIDETQTINTWEEDGNTYKAVGYVHRDGIPWIYKNGEKFMGTDELPLKSVESIWVSEKNKVIFAVENSTEGTKDGVIEFSNQIVRISLPDYQRQETLKEPILAFHGGLHIDNYYPETGKLLVVFASGGACSVNSEIWLVDVNRKEKEIIKKTNYSFCGNKDDGGSKNLGFSDGRFVLANIDVNNNDQSQLFLFNPIIRKEEIFLTGSELPSGVKIESGTLNREKKLIVIFQSLDNGKKYSFDIGERKFVELEQ